MKKFQKLTTFFVLFLLMSSQIALADIAPPGGGQPKKIDPRLGNPPSLESEPVPEPAVAPLPKPEPSSKPAATPSPVTEPPSKPAETSSPESESFSNLVEPQHMIIGGIVLVVVAGSFGVLYRVRKNGHQ